MTDNNRLADIVRQTFPKLRILVIGDAMLDCYLQGDVTRLAQEAPVPVFKKAGEVLRPGGAANVAMNLNGLGLSTLLVTVVGDDAIGEQLIDLLEANGIRVYASTAPYRPTTSKTRIIVGHQHMLRVDNETDAPLDTQIETRVKLGIDTALRFRLDGVLLSDYGKGVLSGPLCRYAIEAAKAKGVPVFVDPKARQFARYAGAEVITPNLAELALATGVAADDLPALEAAGAAMIHDHDIGAIVLTQGPDGMTLIDPAGAAHSSQAHAQEVFDVTGAGDTVIASVAAARCAGLDWRDTLYLANNAAGLVVGRVGAVPIDGTVLLDQLERHSATNGLPIYSFASVAELVKQWRAEGDSIVFTNGCFDLLHIGHVACLEFAKRQGDRLVVAVNTDKQVTALKGARRPVQPLRDRVGIVAGMRAVDAVFAFDGCTPIEHILELQPDVLVKAADYTEAEVVGQEAVDEWGGRVALAPIFEGRSTSAIIKRIKA